MPRLSVVSSGSCLSVGSCVSVWQHPASCALFLSECQSWIWECQSWIDRQLVKGVCAAYAHRPLLLANLLGRQLAITTTTTTDAAWSPVLRWLLRWL